MHETGKNTNTILVVLRLVCLFSGGVALEELEGWPALIILVSVGTIGFLFTDERTGPKLRRALLAELERLGQYSPWP